MDKTKTRVKTIQHETIGYRVFGSLVIKDFTAVQRFSLDYRRGTMHWSSSSTENDEEKSQHLSCHRDTTYERYRIASGSVWLFQRTIKKDNEPRNDAFQKNALCEILVIMDCQKDK